MEDGRLGDASQQDGPLRPAQRILGHTRIIAKVGRVHLAEQKSVPGATLLHDMSLSRVQLHRVLVPRNLEQDLCNYYYYHSFLNTSNGRWRC